MKSMGFAVSDLLETEMMKEVKLIGGEKGQSNEIKGVTIIEAPDIVKFIEGGEVLLTGLYAFKSCTAQEFQGYLGELSKKRVAALVLKRGRNVEQEEEKVELLLGFAKKYKIPVLQVPFEVSFRDIMSLIMERLFNEEVTRLKYFKTTHDNFAALTMSYQLEEGRTEKILDVLAKLIRNPVAIYNQNKICLATSKDSIKELAIAEDANSYEPGIYSKYTYLKQKIKLTEGAKEEHEQLVVLLNVSFGVKMYLAITELNPGVNIMDYIAIENAITALQYEFSRRYMITELEKRFQNDIMHNILNGKIHSMEELQKSTNLLEMDMEGHYRIIMFGVVDEKVRSKEFKPKMEHVEILGNSISRVFTKAKVHNDLNQIIVVQAVSPEQKQEEYRKKIKKETEQVQTYVSGQNKHLKVKAGVGKVVKGILNLPESYREATDAFMFVDIAGEISEGELSQTMLFSDLGIFKLLCQLDDPAMLLEYVPDALRKLYDYKKPQRDDLLITLKTYLDRNQNLTKTAQDLYVHYKTAAYRVEKISNITGIDFDNANEVLAVRIGLVVYKMIENYNKDFI